MEYICHSGGCPGSDMEWENECAKYGIKTIAYSFWNHVQESKNQKILSPDELNEGFERVKIASETLKLPVEYLMNYQKNLLSRNWFQVKNSDEIFAIGNFGNDYHTIVAGGTGWAVEMAKFSPIGPKNIYLFEQNLNSWFIYSYSSLMTNGQFRKFNGVPKLTQKTSGIANFAGIGTRNINKNGILAIKEILYTNLY